MKRLHFMHDYFTQRGGAEKVASRLMNLVNAEKKKAYVIDEKTYPELDVSPVLASFKNAHKTLALKVPLIQLYNLFSKPSEGDWLISSSTFAMQLHVKGKKIIYCHTPNRWLWNPADTRIPESVRKLWSKLDRKLTMRGETIFIANSKATAALIKKAFFSEAKVIYPPCKVNYLKSLKAKIIRKKRFNGEYVFLCGRNRKYREMEAMLKQLAKLDIPAVVISQDYRQFQKSAGEKTILVGNLRSEEFFSTMANAKFTISPGYEDFGMYMVDSIALGTPVIGKKNGGALDIIKEGINGFFFDNLENLETIIKNNWNYSFPEAEMEKSVSFFDSENFDKEILNFLAQEGFGEFSNS